MSEHSHLKQMSFHDSLLTDFRWKDSSIELECEGVLVGDKKYFVSLIIFRVSSLLIDNQSVQHTNDLLMEGEEGDIFRLKLSNNNVLLYVEWENYVVKDKIWREYQIVGENIIVLIGDEIPED